MNAHQLDQWLQEGIGAAKAGQQEKARFRLLDVVEQDQTNEAAWYWLYHVFHRHDDKRICLENLVIINPQNEWARQELIQYLAPNEVSTRQKSSLQNYSTNPIYHPVTRQLIAAFWADISIILLAGGIIAAGQWLISGSSSGVFADYITVVQLFDLFIAIVFVILGIIGINVAVGLMLKSMLGFYGSLVLGMCLLIIGPAISLFATPPNYLVLTCTGGISGMIVLLTLASQPGFKNT